MTQASTWPTRGGPPTAAARHTAQAWVLWWGRWLAGTGWLLHSSCLRTRALAVHYEQVFHSRLVLLLCLRLLLQLLVVFRLVLLLLLRCAMPCDRGTALAA